LGTLRRRRNYIDSDDLLWGGFLFTSNYRAILNYFYYLLSLFLIVIRLFRVKAERNLPTNAGKTDYRDFPYGEYDNNIRYGATFSYICVLFLFRELLATVDFCYVKYKGYTNYNFNLIYSAIRILAFIGYFLIFRYFRPEYLIVLSSFEFATYIVLLIAQCKRTVCSSPRSDNGISPNKFHSTFGILSSVIIFPSQLMISLRLSGVIESWAISMFVVMTFGLILSVSFICFYFAQNLIKDAYGKILIIYNFQIGF